MFRSNLPKQFASRYRFTRQPLVKQNYTNTWLVEPPCCIKHCNEPRFNCGLNGKGNWPFGRPPDLMEPVIKIHCLQQTVPFSLPRDWWKSQLSSSSRTHQPSHKQGVHTWSKICIQCSQKSWRVHHVDFSSPFPSIPSPAISPIPQLPTVQACGLVTNHICFEMMYTWVAFKDLLHWNVSVPALGRFCHQQHTNVSLATNYQEWKTNTIHANINKQHIDHA